MDIVTMKLADLILAEDNVRMHPKRQIEEYKRSLEKFGQTKNAVVDENNNVLVGNGLVIAARALGWEEIYAKQVLDLSENDKLKLMVSDNKIFGLGVDNLDTIDSIFERLHDDLDIPGYDEETLKTMIASMEDVTAEIAGYGKLTSDEIDSIQSRPEARTPSMPVSQIPVTQSAANTPQPQIHENNDISVDSPNADKFVTCSECGNKIYL